jgi:ATP-binding cassette subfamily B multidrug efflux pump
MIFLLLSIYIIGSIAAIWQNRMMIAVAQKTVSVIRADLFSKLQTLPLKFFDSNNHGELMSRFTNDVDNVSDSLNTSILQLFAST